MPVTDEHGRVVYVKRTNPSTGSEVFFNQTGGRRPSQDDLARTGDPKVSEKIICR